MSNLPSLILFLLLALLAIGQVEGKGPSRDNKLFIECAIRGPKQSGQEPETVVSHASMDNNRVLFFGLGGNLYAGNNELKELCKEDKEFAQTSKAAPKMKQGTVEKCDQSGGLTLKGGRAMKFTSKKNGDFNQCYAGQYELFECTKQACGGKEKLVLLEKDSGSAKSYAFVHAGKLTVKEFTFAEISAAEMECVKKACPKDSLPVVEEVVRWKAKAEKKADTKGKFKVYKECAVKRKRAGASPDETRLETLMAQVKMDKQVLFFGMGGNLYTADSVLANECAEDKIFTKSNLKSMHATFLGCNKANPKGGKAKLTIKTREKMQLEVATNKHAKGSQCQVQQSAGRGTKGQFDIYKCPKEACGGKDQVLMIKKEENAKNKLVSGGRLLVEEVLFAEIAPKQWQCVQELCGKEARIPVVESAKRKLDKSAKGQNAEEPEEKQEKQKRKRRGRKPKQSGKGTKTAGEAANNGGARGRGGAGGAKSAKDNAEENKKMLKELPHYKE